MGSQLTTLTSADIRALRARRLRGGQAGVLARRRPRHGTAVVAGTGRHARHTPRRPLQLAPGPGRPEGRQARSRPGQDPDRAGTRRLRRPARPGRLVAAERLGPSPRHLSRAGRLGGADQALALGQSLRTAPRSPEGAVRGQLHRPGRAARRRNPDPVRLTSPADPAGTPDSRGPAARFDREAWERFHRSHPWLMALTGQAPSPADRIAAFMDRETIVDGVPLRVVELTGEPGDMVFCHPAHGPLRALRTGARGRASCGSSSRFSPARAARCCAC